MRIRAAALFCLMISVTAFAADLQLATLKKGDAANGFHVAAVYLDAADKPIGARFIHDRSGFTLDYLQIESVPQGYTWVNSIPVSDQGEPHTQEHLLLGKGTTGRAFAGLDTMWLSGSNAFTQQWRTSYNFNTSAGPNVFFDLFGAELNALLHPNYSDEEIRREVRNWGVTEKPDHTLGLEEKGSVFNEMVSSSTNRYRVLGRAMDHLVYGAHHPLAYNSGGEPSGIRTMKAEDIRNFHAANYYLANMGTIVAFPQSVALSDVLSRTDAILKKVEAKPKQRESTTSKPLPKPEPGPAGSIVIAEYPTKNDQQPSPVALSWPAVNNLSPNDLLLAEIFMNTFAGDATTNLYKMFVDSKTRVVDIGATGVSGDISTDQGNPISITFIDVAASNLTNDKIADIRKRTTDEISRIAALPDDSAELKDLNERVLSRLTERERDLAKLINTPPSFGGRNTGSVWMDQFLYLEKTPDFRKSITLKPQIAAIRKQLATGKNIWRDALSRWQLVGVTPYAAAARPSPSLLQREEAERTARAQTETERLMKQYALTDPQAAIHRYRDEYEAESARIEEEAKKVTPATFVSTPPMTLDESIKYAATKTAAGVPIVTSTFENMTSATLGVALSVDQLAPSQLRYLSLMPALLTRSGVIENGKPVSYEEMSERLRKEILGLNAYFSTNLRKQRVELVVRGAGIGADEAKRAIGWMTLVLQHPDWRPENLPRLRDVVDQSLQQLRNTMSGQEEQWVQNPANAYRMQTNPYFLNADSFLTRSHNALRLRWLLKEAPAADRDALTAFFNDVAAQKNTPRAELKTWLAKRDVTSLSPAAQAIAKDALKDLDLTLIEIPDSSLPRDFEYLANAMRDDLLTPPADVLASLDAARKQLLHRNAARMFFVTSTANQQALSGDVDALAASLDATPATRNPAGTTRLIDARLAERGAATDKPIYVGLNAPNMKGGVIATSVPGVHISDFDDKEKQLDYLASRLFGGGGAHGMFLKTLAAGLAYSNGPSASPTTGRMGYYAERTPEIPQTVKFVIDVVKNGHRDPSLADYTIAQAFGETRANGTYEARAEAIANDLTDGYTPDLVRKFRTSILELRKDPELGNKLFDRKDAVYGRTLPGFNVKGKDVPDAIYFTIGPDRQLDAWEAYLRSVEGADTRLYRLYPRDYWLVVGSETRPSS
ncbi:MAG: Zn-dependent peptidase (Insulinase) family [Acidobacteria bacterium]|nr:Zn-dependent peptidase (Insulinase) family [Acidobacteriota bacterium]